jgi:cyclopropane fatty-acyl-phospholipid synthase-like methyltransferase
MDLRSILAWPAAYRAFRNAVGGNKREYVETYLKPRPGDRVLDIGCGPGDILELLPDVNYLGIDVSEEYITSARARFGTKGRFECKAVHDVVVEEPSSYDLVMANGVVHHLDDDEAVRLFEHARDALKPGGRLVTLDGCVVDGQSPVARRLLRMDRGKHVRTRDEYVRLASRAFSDVTSEIHHDMLRIPFTHIIMVMTK